MSGLSKLRETIYERTSDTLSDCKICAVSSVFTIYVLTILTLHIIGAFKLRITQSGGHFDTHEMPSTSPAMGMVECLWLHGYTT